MLNVSVGLLEGLSAVEVELTGTFTDSSGKSYTAGRHRFTSEVTLTPSDPASCAFALDDVTIGLSLLCALPGDVIERALLDKNRETLLILAKALNFSWETMMALLFLGAKDHRITAQDLRDLEGEYGRLNIETSRSVLAFYQSRKNGEAAEPGAERQPALAVP